MDNLALKELILTQALLDRALCSIGRGQEHPVLHFTKVSVSLQQNPLLVHTAVNQGPAQWVVVVPSWVVYTYMHPHSLTACQCLPYQMLPISIQGFSQPSQIYWLVKNVWLWSRTSIIQVLTAACTWWLFCQKSLHHLMNFDTRWHDFGLTVYVLLFAEQTICPLKFFFWIAWPLTLNTER